jgi:hypothetical protein
MEMREATESFGWEWGRGQMIDASPERSEGMEDRGWMKVVRREIESPRILDTD